MKIIFLGTCSGTEPRLGRRHCSFVLQHHDALYWFDCGESCSYTAHTSGLDLLTTRAVFISHTHMDHIGGLPNLLWNLRKLTTLGGGRYAQMAGRHLDVLIPDLEVWQGILQMLRGTEGGFAINFQLDARSYQDGVIFRDGNLQIKAVHNLHLGIPAEGQPWRSFSLRIEAEKRVIVYSGDIGHIREMEAFLDGCDLLLMETGHHDVEEVCRYVCNFGKGIRKLGFHHHGVAILNDPAGELRKAQAILGDRVFFSADGMELQV